MPEPQASRLLGQPLGYRSNKQRADHDERQYHADDDTQGPHGGSVQRRPPSRVPSPEVPGRPSALMGALGGDAEGGDRGQGGAASSSRGPALRRRDQPAPSGKPSP